MKKKTKNVSKNILVILTNISLFLYFIFFLEEIIHSFEGQSILGWIMVYTLFLIFLIAYSFSWKKEKISGIIFLIWYTLIWICSLFIWENAGTVVVISTPVFLIGVALIIYDFKK